MGFKYESMPDPREDLTELQKGGSRVGTNIKGSSLLALTLLDEFPQKWAFVPCWGILLVRTFLLIKSGPLLGPEH